MSDPWLVALDVDGTILLQSGELTEPVQNEVRRVAGAGHEVMIATGRAVETTLPVVEALGIRPEYLVCSNGAVTMRRDDDAPLGYTHAHIETFNPRHVLSTVFEALSEASFAVEDAHGTCLYVGEFPAESLGVTAERVEFEELFIEEATRVVVISPEHAAEEFLGIVESLGLHKVSYNIGWTSWLDIAPDGVNKATGMERVRAWLDVPRSRVMAVGDGSNDIELLEWASVQGLGVAMGQASDRVKDAGNQVTGDAVDHGLAAALTALE